MAASPSLLNRFVSSPSYELWFNAHRVQVRTGRQSYVNALLIASRGTYFVAACANIRAGHFGSVVRVPGFCEGACASCEWKSHRSRCLCRNSDEQFVPAVVPRALPPGLGGLTM